MRGTDGYSMRAAIKRAKESLRLLRDLVAEIDANSPPVEEELPDLRTVEGMVAFLKVPSKWKNPRGPRQMAQEYKSLSAAERAKWHERYDPMLPKD